MKVLALPRQLMLSPARCERCQLSVIVQPSSSESHFSQDTRNNIFKFSLLPSTHACVLHRSCSVTDLFGYALQFKQNWSLIPAHLNRGPQSASGRV